MTPAKHEAPVSQRLPEQAGHFSLAAHGQYKANLHLNHDDIGHIQAKIEVLDNQSSVTLITDNQDAKMMVQSQLSQLKSSFAEADLNLLQANVEEQSTADKQHKENNDHAHYELMPPSVSLESTPKMMKKQLINTLVDTYV